MLVMVSSVRCWKMWSVCDVTYQYNTNAQNKGEKLRSRRLNTHIHSHPVTSGLGWCAQPSWYDNVCGVQENLRARDVEKAWMKLYWCLEMGKIHLSYLNHMIKTPPQAEVLVWLSLVILSRFFTYWLFNGADRSLSPLQEKCVLGGNSANVILSFFSLTSTNTFTVHSVKSIHFSILMCFYLFFYFMKNIVLKGNGA